MTIIAHSSKPIFLSRHVIIGGGVVGLAVASRLSKQHHHHYQMTILNNNNNNKDASSTQPIGREDSQILNTLLIEKNRFIGEETSSRNSEVIHAGIYYPEQSLKTKLCNIGGNLLYKYCKQRDIATRRIGKWIVGNRDEDVQYLETMKLKTDSILESKSDRLFFLSRQQMISEEPFLKAKYALCSPKTGIADSHSLMRSLNDEIESEESSMVQCLSKVKAIEYRGSQKGEALYHIHTDDCIIETPFVVNCAGLYSEHIARMLWRNGDESSFPEQYRIYYYKGQYFSYQPSSSNRLRCKINHLIYPIPDPGLAGLGIHATIDMKNKIKFGPDVHFQRPAFSDDELRNTSNIDQLLCREELFDYKVDESQAQHFHEVICTYLKGVEAEDLVADYAGMRPKLMAHGTGKFQDFIIQNEEVNGFPGFINLLGIESPGLTSSLAVANYVADLAGYSNKFDFK